MYYDIHKRRLELGLTLEDVGRKVGVSKGTVKKWESGMIDNMKRDKIALLADVLEISPLELIGIKTSKNNFSLSDHEQQLIDNYRQLNGEGQEKLLDLSSDLVASGRYIKNSQPETLADHA